MSIAPGRVRIHVTDCTDGALLFESLRVHIYALALHRVACMGFGAIRARRGEPFVASSSGLCKINVEAVDVASRSLYCCQDSNYAWKSVRPGCEVPTALHARQPCACMHGDTACEAVACHARTGQAAGRAVLRSCIACGCCAMIRLQVAGVFV